jgi:hypothetical protein
MIGILGISTLIRKLFIPSPAIVDKRWFIVDILWSVDFSVVDNVVKLI